MINQSKNNVGVIIFFLVKLGMSKKSISDKIIIARRILLKMTGNPDFPTTNPTLAVVKTKTDDLESAESAMDGSKLKTDLRNTALAEFEMTMNLLQADVENQAAGNTAKILGAGFELRDAPTKAVILPAPTKVSVKSLQAGVKISWKSNRKSKMNVIQGTNQPTLTQWEVAGQSTKSSIVITGLTPGQQYFFKVAHVNSAGVSEFSEIVGVIPNF